MLQMFVVKIFFPDLHRNSLYLNSISAFSEIISVYQLNPQSFLFKKIVCLKLKLMLLKDLDE